LSSLDPRTRAITTAPSAAELPPLIELDHASVVRGQVKVLHGLSLRIAQGQHTALLGPNGCGKSTFIKLITRELYPLAQADGRVAVKVLGQNRWQVDRLRSQLGIVTGDLSSNLADMPGLTAEQAGLGGFFASYVVPSFREITTDMRERAAQSLAMTGALALRGRVYAELSAGEARRVLIARALVNRPRCCWMSPPPGWTWWRGSSWWRPCACWPSRASPWCWSPTTSKRSFRRSNAWCCCAMAGYWPMERVRTCCRMHRCRRRSGAASGWWNRRAG